MAQKSVAFQKPSGESWFPSWTTSLWSHFTCHWDEASPGVTLPAVEQPQGYHRTAPANAAFFKEHKWLGHGLYLCKRRSFLFLCIAIFILLFLTQIFSILISSRWEEMSSSAALCTAAGHPRLRRFRETPSLPDSPALVWRVSCHDMARWGKSQRNKMLNQVSPNPCGILLNFLFLLSWPEQNYSQKKGMDSLLLLPYARVS